MPIKINNIKVSLDSTNEEIKEQALKKISAKASACTDFKILRRSVDARKNQVSFVYSVCLFLKNEEKIACDGVNAIKFPEEKEEKVLFGEKKLKSRPVVIGMGPCGLFCAYHLAKNGYMPIVLERGEDVDNRTKSVNKYFCGKELNTNSNIQFGEGGAGTFSDGKLTTRINDPLSFSVLDTFVRFGAFPNILIDAKPHIGTDVLKTVVKNMRNEIIALGGDVRFNSKVTDFIIKNNKIVGVILENGEEILSDSVILAIGHSARDTYKKLFNLGITIEQKDFSVGARIEHKQSFIDKSMYGDYAGHPKLSAADYSLSFRDKNVGCYSFCMCPGGMVVAAASEEKTVVTNGMSEYKRDGENANSAICVSVSSRDFKSNHPLAGVEFQREIEKNAYILGGENYSAPVCLVSDYLEGKKTVKLGSVIPSYPIGIRYSNLNDLYRSNINNMLANGIRAFDKKIKGFSKNGAILTGAETRTSAPVRILRQLNGESVAISGLYPAGEGAGYAGGIMSAAIDGIKVAKKIMALYSPFM